MVRPLEGEIVKDLCLNDDFTYELKVASLQ